MLIDIAASRRRLGQSPSHRLVAAVGGKTRRNRVAVLLAQVARRTEALLVCQSAAQELAQLARDDGAMREEILLANGDVALVRTLKSAVSDPQLLRWLLLALAHLAVDGRTRQRQKSAVPRMAQLLESGVPAVAEASARALLALAPCAACHEVMLRYGGPDTLATAQRVQAASGAAASAPSPARKAAGEAPDSGAAALRGRSTREELLAEQAAGEARVGRSAVAIQARTRGMRARKLAAGESQITPAQASVAADGASVGAAAGQLLLTPSPFADALDALAVQQRLLAAQTPFVVALDALAPADGASLSSSRPATDSPTERRGQGHATEGLEASPLQATISHYFERDGTEAEPSPFAVALDDMALRVGSAAVPSIAVTAA